MAEVVGLVAASIELSRTVLELKQTFQEVRKVPKEISSLIEESERLSRLLSLVLKNQNDLFPHVQPEREIREIQDSCQAAVDDLLALCNDINVQLQKSRWRGSLKAATRKDDLLDLQRRLDRAKSSLHLAQTAHNTMLLYQLMLQNTSSHMLLAAESAVQAPHVGHIPAITSSDPECASDNCSPSMPCLVTQRTRMKSASKRLRKQGRTSYGFRLPVRWLNWALHVKAEQSFNGWTINIRTWNYRSFTSPVFEYAACGDIDAMRHALVSNEASRSDLGPGGLSPLHFALLFGQLQMAQMLIECGFDVSHRDEHCRTPLSYIGVRGDGDAQIWGLPFEERRSIQLKSTNSLLDLMSATDAEFLIDTVDYFPLWRDMPVDLRGAQLQQLTYESLLARFEPTYRSKSLAERIRLVIESCVKPPVSFLGFLGQSLDQECIKTAECINLDVALWNRIVVSLGSYMHHCRCDTERAPQEEEQLEHFRQNSLAGWREILQQYVKLQSAEWFNSDIILDSVLEYLRGSICSSEAQTSASVTSRIQACVAELLGAGISAANFDGLSFFEYQPYVFLPLQCFSAVANDNHPFYGKQGKLEIVDLQTGADAESWSATIEWTERSDNEPFDVSSQLISEAWPDDSSDEPLEISSQLIPGAWPDDSNELPSDSTSMATDSDDKRDPSAACGHESDNDTNNTKEGIHKGEAETTLDGHLSTDSISNPAKGG